MTLFWGIKEGKDISLNKLQWDMGAGKPPLIWNILFALNCFTFEESEYHKDLVQFNNFLKKQDYIFSKWPGIFFIFFKEKNA